MKSKIQPAAVVASPIAVRNNTAQQNGGPAHKQPAANTDWRTSSTKRALAIDILKAALPLYHEELSMRLNQLCEANLLDEEEASYAKMLSEGLSRHFDIVSKIFGRERRGDERFLPLSCLPLVDYVRTLRENAYWILESDEALCIEEQISNLLEDYRHVRGFTQSLAARQAVDSGSTPEEIARIPDVGESPYLVLLRGNSAPATTVGDTVFCDPKISDSLREATLKGIEQAGGSTGELASRILHHRQQIEVLWDELSRALAAAA